MAISLIITNPWPPTTISHIPRGTPNHSSSSTRSPWPNNSSKSNSSLEAAMQTLEHYSMGAKQPEEQQTFYNSIISMCIATKSLRQANHLRSHMARVGYAPSVFLDNQFINMYSKCGEIAMARQVFDGMPERNVVSWNALITGYCSNGCFSDALALFCSMIEVDLTPNEPTFLSVLRASTDSKNLKHGEQIHACIVKMGLPSCITLSNALISMYSKFCRAREAEKVFASTIVKDKVSWNSIIAAKAQNGYGMEALHLLVEMVKEGFEPDDYTFGCLFSSTDVTAIKEIHSQIIKRGLSSNVIVGSALVDAYARCEKPVDACLVFNRMPERNAVAWNSVLSACFTNEMEQEGLKLFLKMGEKGELPDEYTASILLKAAATQWPVIVGKQLHGLAVKMGMNKDAMIGNSLITMYAKHGEASDSRLAFENILEPDLISWNSIIHSYLQNEQFEQALMLYVQMKAFGIEPDEFSFVAALAACAELIWHNIGRGIHCDLVKTGMAPDAFVGSALIDMYSKFMATFNAMMIFDKIKDKDLVTWNSMISAFAQSGYISEAMKLLCLMREENFEPDDFTFASVLAACANTIQLENGKQVHSLILKSNQVTDAAVANALITMYSRAGSISEAEKVFSMLSNKSLVTWTTMIGAYVQCGYSREALKIFKQMESSGVLPNDRTFVAMLMACSYAGMSDEAERHFKSMETKYGIKPGFNHFTCMVDVLGRAGKLEAAEEFIRSMPYKPDILVWKTLLSACRIHGDVERGKTAMEKIVALDPSDSAAYVLLSNLYASVANWDGVMEVRQLMKDNGVKKEPGKSWIEVHNRSHEFVAGDCSHPQTDEIYSKLKELFKQMKAEGYIPGMESLTW